MDKKIGQLIDKINAVGLSGNTIIIFMGDNGTAPDISSMYKGYSITGGKNGSTIYGTHVPLIVDWPGTIAPQQSSPDLIDAADFLPTIASLADTREPSGYGVLDGVSFYPSLFEPRESERDWIYCYWKPGNLKKPTFKVWVQDEHYKLYDSTNKNLFFDIAADPLELSPLSESQFTPAEAGRKKTFDSVLQAMH
jgi:arylsulfatase A-like enzyme